MANPLPEEKEFYSRIKSERISIPEDIWDLLYYRIGDDVTAINLLCQYYLASSQPVPIEEARKILSYTRHIKEIVTRMVMSSKDDSFFPEFGGAFPLHPIIREMFTHYIGNDVYMINLIVGDTVDPLEPHPLSLEITRKILSHTRTIREFMERLRRATLHNETEFNASADEKSKNKQLTKEELFLKVRRLLSGEFKIEGEEKITPASRFNEDLCLDPVDNIRAVIAIEDAFGFEIADSDADNILTVADAVEYVFKRLKEERE